MVTNVTNFGASVDIGVHQDGLVHISALANQYVKDPRDVVKAGDVVKVKVLEVDVKHNTSRRASSMSHAQQQQTSHVPANRQEETGVAEPPSALAVSDGQKGRVGDMPFTEFKNVPTQVGLHTNPQGTRGPISTSHPQRSRFA